MCPPSHPEERTGPSRAEDLRRSPGPVGRVGGIRYLPHEWAHTRISSTGRSSLRRPGACRVPSGVVPREA